MSLSRILNDEGPSQPHPPPTRHSPSPHLLPAEPPFPHPQPSRHWDTEPNQPPPPPVPSHPVQAVDARPPPTMADDYFHNDSFHGPTVWATDAQSTLPPPLPLDSNTEPDTEPSRFGLPPESWAPFGSKEAARRRRRKHMADEAEARALSARRAKRPKRAPSRVGEPNAPLELELEDPVKLSEEEMRLQSTDLEDCEEIWISELADYVLETRKRENVIESEFEASTLATNSDIASHLSRNYVRRMNSIPLRQPTPPLPPLQPAPPQADYDGHYPGPVPSPNPGPGPSRHPSEDIVEPAHQPEEPAQEEWVSYDRFPEDLARTKHPHNQEEEPHPGHYPPEDFPRPPGETRKNNYYRNRNEIQFSEYVPPPPPETVSTGPTIFIEEGIPGSKKGRGKDKGKDKDKSKAKLTDKGKGKAKSSTSDAESEQVDGEKNGEEPATKKRKLDNGEPMVSVIPYVSEREYSPVRSVTAPVPRSDTPDSVSSKVATKRKATRKKPEVSTAAADSTETPKVVAPQPQTLTALLGTPRDENPPSVPSRATSPALTGYLALIHEIGESVPPLRKAKKADHATLVRRVKTLEEAQKKVWTNIARRDIAKAHKFHVQGYQARQSQAERVAKLASMQARKPFVKTSKAGKEVQTKARRLMREMQVFWKKNEREERDVRKREQKEANDRAKVEEEAREAARQARKLEFLISQTELYSHFVGSKLKTSELEGEENSAALPAGAQLEDVDPDSLRDIDFNDEDTSNLHHHARRNAKEAIEMAKQKAQDFDSQRALERKTNEALQLSKGQAHLRDDMSEVASQADTNGNSGNPLVDLDSDELNFQNPTSLSGPLTITQPNLLMAQLKEYQLKGLNWLATLYEQGINGILADEMGLGKTIQSISLIAYLAETHDIWGPFLVVAPSSTLHNWQQELTRFVPSIKALPYWGNPKDRATLRKFWSKKEISYNQDAPFHVLITSYNLITQDQQYFQRVKWQYMILDEAQNIKNSASVRWKTLLGLQCRNRLLLTGTPIQNSMQELWALLHFIMPSLFDSHDEFSEWFSKDIESAAENKGSGLGEHQLRRLHMILKPFMLRRVKRHVQNELSEKIETDIFVDLSARQRALYKTLLSNVSITDLLAKATNLGDADSARTLMNLVMQFRKVCNHPELFERADIVAPYSFCAFGRPGPPNREGDSVILPYSTHNPIEYRIPRLLYEDGGLEYVPRENSTNPSRSKALQLLNIWHPEWLHRSQYEDAHGSTFAFLRLTNIDTQSACSLHTSSIIQRIVAGVRENIARQIEEEFLESSESFLAVKTASNPFVIHTRLLRLHDKEYQLPSPSDIALSSWRYSCLSRRELKSYIPRAVAPPIAMYCSERNFVEQQERLREAPLESLLLFGTTPRLQESEEACQTFRARMQKMPMNGIFGASPVDQVPATAMKAPQAKKLIYDSAKLARLDTLLQELKAGDHRVLIYFQMTRMMDLMEEYLVYRQYKYLRLDGSSKIEDRRDMVMDWQTRPDIFIFILSTRAGGLGINLTAADTVVFYDHDWNPSNDAQAMDRAHRLGQTRQVTVYRLITKGTIDERIVQLARVKKDVQDIVVGNKNLADMTKPKDIAQLLLNDEQLVDLGANDSGGATPVPGLTTGGESWGDEGDDFFGHPAGAPTTTVDTQAEDEAPAANGSTRGKRRRGGKAGGAPRGRKPAGAPRRKRGGAATGYTV